MSREDVSPSADSVLRNFLSILDSILRKFDPAAVGDILTDNAVFELPFAPKGIARRYEGRREVEEFLRAAGQMFSTITFYDIEVHAMVDRSLAVAEFRSHGILASTSRPYRNRYVAIARVRGDRVAEYREFFDPRSPDG